MKNILAGRFGTFLLIYNILLSIVGIAAGAAALKLEQYNNLLLVALPISLFRWFFVILVTPSREKREEEIEAHENDHTSDSQDMLTENDDKYANLKHFLFWLIFLIVVLVFCADFAMNIVILGKMYG